MFYKYETHLHTSEVSKCACSTGAEMARAYKEAGFTGIFVTDHFVNGNCSVPRHVSWDLQMEMFVQGYENARREGEKIGLDVFFGWEFTHNPYGHDYLTYNLDKEFLLAHPGIDVMPIEKYSRLVRESGGLIIQAHPYRRAFYLLYEPDPKPDLVDGIEVNNSESSSPHNNNHLAWELARAHPNLIRTSGCDIHGLYNVGICGVAFRHRIENSQHFVESLKAGEGYLIIDGRITDREGNIIE
ncbi:MAG TPA: histidinol-phosphatase [Clostridiales bacterium]|nr:histidinol-phosphatase [Clostridiales bacterium]